MQRYKYFAIVKEKMQILNEIENLSYKETGASVEARLGIYKIIIPKEKFRTIGSYSIKNSRLIYNKRDKKRLKLLIESYSRISLVSCLTERKTEYITEQSKIPLFGTNYFGIIDRNSSLIEIRPLTGCNYDCIYCSVAEGRKKEADYLVDPDYMLSELKSYLDSRKGDFPLEAKEKRFEIHINAQGEPLLYPWILLLISNIRKMKLVRKISLDTNGSLLNKKKLEDLEKAGLSQLNISINATSNELASKLANRNCNITRLLRLIKKNSCSKMQILLAPLLINGLNNRDIEKLVEFAKQNHIRIAIQNFLAYKQGRRPVKELPMGYFFRLLRNLEKKHGIKLVFCEDDFSIVKLKKQEKSFRKGEIIDAMALASGRRKSEVIASARNRAIVATGAYKEYKRGQKLRLKLTRTKHCIYYGKVL